MEEYDQDLSPDDFLEQERAIRIGGDPGIRPLPGDEERPAEPAHDPYAPPLPEDYPAKDTGIDPAEAYDAGEDIFEVPGTEDSKESL